MRAWLQEGRWLRADRVAAIARVVLAVLGALTLTSPWTVPELQLAQDFGAFWTASRLALHGAAADAYGAPAQAAMAALLGPGQYPPFLYPPVALLLWSPFGALPFPVAAALWLAVTAGLFAGVVRLIAGRAAVLPALACPAALVCAFYGQNSFLSAALLGGVALTLDRRPVLAGMLVGCLAWKPQLAILVPVAWALAGRWRACASAAATLALLLAASVRLFGPGAWAGFVASLPVGAAWNAGGAPGYDKYASLFAAARLVGASVPEAWACQAAGIATALVLLGLTAWRRPGGMAETAMLICATALATPFLGEYELVLLIIPAAWLAQDGFRPFERVVLALLFVAPLGIKLAAIHGLPLAPLAIVVLTALVGRRAWAFNPASPHRRPAPRPA